MEPGLPINTYSGDGRSGMMKVGERVGAVQSAGEKTVHLYGYGVYVGDEVPPSGLLHEIGLTNPKIQLDNGGIVWGQECWWGDEEAVKKMIGQREIIMVGGEVSE
jgi:hypothetical protein